MTILLLGDSHLAFLYVDHPDLVASWGKVECRAFGGATMFDLPGQVRGLDLRSYDAVVVSVGSNDLFLGETPLDTSKRFDEFVDQHPGVTWVWLESPNFPNPVPGLPRSVPTLELLAPLGGNAYLSDGVHLSRAAYEVLVPAIAAQLGTTST